jgi:hypothetical protein
MGESKSPRVREVAALRLGIELGMSFIDTAETAVPRRLSPKRFKDNTKAFLLLRKFIRIMHHARNCQNPVSAVSSASVSTRLIFIFCTGASEPRRSKKLSTLSRTYAQPER